MIIWILCFLTESIINQGEVDTVEFYLSSAYQKKRIYTMIKGQDKIEFIDPLTRHLHRYGMETEHR